MEYITCSCRKTPKCLTSTCECRDNGLHCTDLCKCNECENEENADVLLKISQNAHENVCVGLSFLIKLQPPNFSVDFVKFLRTSFLQNTSSGCFSPQVRQSLTFNIFVYTSYIAILGDFIHQILGN